MKPKKSIILYMPVIHMGYLQFLEKYLGLDDAILLVDCKQLLGEIPALKHMERDLRAVPAKDVATWLRTYPCWYRKVGVIGSITGIKSNLDSLEQVVMPDDDITAAILELVPELKTKVTLEKMFLRWDMKATLLQHAVEVPKISAGELPPGLIEALQKNMAKSVDWWRQTGTIVFDAAGNILIGAYNRHFPNDLALNIFGDPRFNFKPGQHLDYFTSIHAEAAAVGLAAREGQSLQGLNMLVSDFPCGNCAKLIALTGIKNLFFLKGYSNIDGQKVIENAGITITQVLV